MVLLAQVQRLPENGCHPVRYRRWAGALGQESRMVTSRVWTTKVEEMLVPVSSRRSLENASPGVFNQDHWVVTVRSYRGLCLCHANRAHGSMCTVLKRNPGKPPGKCPNCARSDLKLFFSEKINLPGFRFQNITCRFFCVCLSTWPLFFCQSFSHANIHS